LKDWQNILKKDIQVSGMKKNIRDTTRNNFTNKVAVITGGASGIGRALCEELAYKGAIVIVADINTDVTQEVASAINRNGGRTCAAQLDVSRQDEMEKLIGNTVKEFGHIDYMFNNAGISICGEARDVSLKQWKNVMDVNLWGVIYGTLAAYQVMVKQGYGHIINTASLGGLMPEPMSASYVTAKHGVVGMSLSLRLEAANLGVKVSVVCPGMVKTGIFESAMYVRVKPEEAARELSSLPMIDAGQCAKKIIQGVVKNKAIILDSLSSRIYWWLYRLNPAIVAPFLNKGLNDLRALRFYQ
jgi:NAD(P)-dependent dehydrogenase (short-subunit alcohol dehydrogenase family)